MSDLEIPEYLDDRFIQLHELFGSANEYKLVCDECSTKIKHRSDTDEHETYMTSKCPNCGKSWSISHGDDEDWKALLLYNIEHKRRLDTKGGLK